MRRPSVSRRTIRLAVFSVLATALVYLLIVLGVGGESGIMFVADIGETLIAAVAASAMLWAALQFRPREPLRRHWLLIAIGVGFFTLGDVVWTYYEVVRGVAVPYPSLADVFYVLEYPFSAAGLIGAALAYRKIFDVRRPLAVSGAIVIAAAAVAWFGFVDEVFADTSGTMLERVLGVASPLGGLFLLLLPALFIVLVIGPLRGGRLAWPWWAAASGLAIRAVTDTAFAWLDWSDAYASGHIIDMGWMLGYSLLAVGASLAVDVHQARRS